MNHYNCSDIILLHLFRSFLRAVFFLLVDGLYCEYLKDMVVPSISIERV